MPTSLYVQALSRAAVILGGMHQLRAHLRVSIRELEAWVAGTEKPPIYIFLKVVDVISGQTTASSSELLHQSKELRVKARQVVSAAQAARDRAVAVTKRSAGILEHSLHLRAALLEAAGVEVARRPSMTADDFLAKDFALSEGSLILENALNAAVNGTAATRANIQLACPGGLRIAAHIGFDQPFLEFFALVGHETPACCGTALETAQRVVVSDVRTDPIFAGTLAGDVMGSASALACQSTPLTGSSGEVIGMLSTHYEKPHQPSAQELATLDLICQRASFWLGGQQPLAR